MVEFLLFINPCNIAICNILIPRGWMQDQYINEEFSFSRLFYSGLKYYKFIYIIRLDKN